jgi:hypothetical protein
MYPLLHVIEGTGKMNVLLLGIELYLAAMLGVSGLAKIEHPGHFAATLRRHRILPNWTIEGVSRIVPWLEVVIAVLLVVGLAPVPTALFTVLLFTSFLTIEVMLVVTNRATECGCYGLAYSQKVDYASIVASIFLVSVAILHLWGIIQFEPVAMFLRFLAILLFGSASSWLVWRMWLKSRQRGGSVQHTTINIVVPPSS